MFVRVGTPELGWHAATQGGKTWSATTQKEGNQRDALEDCKKRGLTLPSIKDFETLSSYFERREDGQFSNTGLTEINALFPDLEGATLWSSSAHPILDIVYETFDSRNVTFSRSAYINTAGLAAKCVSKPLANQD